MKGVRFFNPVQPTHSNWQNFQLILPAIGVGNIGQLSVDLLISTLKQDGKCILVGRIFSKALKSVSGPNAFDLKDPHVTTTCEVYEISSLNLVVIQQRAPPHKELRKLYVKQLSDWIEESKFRSVITLASGFVQYLLPSLLSTLQKNVLFRFSPTSSCDIAMKESFIKKTGIQEFSREIFAISEEMYGLDYPGIGIARLYWKEWESRGIKSLFLILFCSEGDNTPEALEMIQKLDLFLDISKNLKQDSRKIFWKTPVSWSHLNNPNFPEHLY